MITYDEFAKLEIKVATVLTAERIEGADRLLKLTLDIGTEQRTVAAGIAQHYKPEKLVGKQVIYLSNLEPKMLRGVQSQGMVLAADSEGKPILLKPEKKVPKGCKVR